MSNKLDNWCPEIYRSVFIDRFNNDHIQVAPCCQSRPSIEPVNSFNFNNNKFLTNLRQQFDQGKKPVECNKCWAVENVGHKSRRQSAIDFYNIEPNNQVELNSIDYSATWACNMSCIMCGPINSSVWAKELNYTSEQLTNIGRYFQKDNNILDQLDIGQIKKIHFNGGEPFLNNHQTSLLERLEEQDVLKNTFISYNTNGSIIPNDKIIKYWSCSRLVKLFFSIDATGAAFEYIRYPGKWKEIEHNIQTMKQQLPSNVMFGINLAVGGYNLLELADLWQWFETTISKNREGDPSDFNWQLVSNFDPSHVRTEVKQRAISELENVSALNGIAEYLKSTLDYSINDKWINKLNSIDQRRNTNWRKSLKIGRYY